MRLSCPQDLLTTATAWVARALPARPVEPVLHGVLIDAQPDGRVRLSAYNHDIAADTTLDADVTTPGRVLVSGALLATVAKLLPAQPVTVTLGDDATVGLACGTARFTLPTLPIVDYPTLPALPAYVGEVDAVEFADAVRQVAVAAGADLALPQVFGVLIEAGREQPLRLVATDRFRLAVREVPWQPTTDAPDQVTVRVDARDLAGTVKPLAAGTGGAAGAGGMIRLSAAPDAGLFGLADATGTRRTTLATLAGEYIEWRRHTPPAGAATAAVPVGPLTDAVRRAAVFTERAPQVTLTFTAGEVEVAAGGHDTGRGRDTVPITYTGDPVTVAFKPAYLLDALATLRTDQAEVQLSAPHRPVFLRPVDPAVQAMQHHQHLLMPVRLPPATATAAGAGAAGRGAAA